jgi:signal transduction histidine kinase
MDRRPFPAAVDRMRKLERGLARVRWFGIALGVYEVIWYADAPEYPKPHSADVIAGIALGLLLAVNVAIHLLLPRLRTARALRTFGTLVFALDMTALWSITWAYNFERYGATWVLLSIMCLEGALRFQFRGAMTPVLIAIPVEIAREAAAHNGFGYPFVPGNIIFRIGFMAIIGAVGGMMARNLERGRTDAEARARENEQLAERERSARTESTAFQRVILAGVSETGLQEALEAMLSVIAEALGYRSLAVLLIDEQRLVPVATHGLPPVVADESLPLGEGISGTVAVTGRREIVPDVSKDARYFAVEPATRSQITLPISAGERIIGVLDVESPDLDAFDEADAARLERLCAQIGLVIDKARLLAQERATVERMRELELMKADFIAIASHELRTPLTAMQGSIKTLRRPDFKVSPELLEEFLATLDRQSERLTRLVEDLLLASRIDAGSVSLTMEPTSVERVLQDVLLELGPRAARVSLAFPPNMPDVATDGQRVGQIARNLIENALKFSTADSTVRVTVHHDQGARPGLLIEVVDHGHGIEEEELPRIFERFHQIGGSMRRRADGFGLGLYITKRLIEALSGSIEVDSVLGRGTVFRVWLPLPVEGAPAGATEIA